MELGERLLLGSRGLKCNKFGFLDIFSETARSKFLIFCMMVEGNKAHHLSVMPFLGKILTQDQLGD